VIVRRRDSALFRFDAAAPAPPDPPGYRFAGLGFDALENAPLALARGRAAKFRARLDQGYACAGYRDADGVVRSYVWIAGGAAGPHAVPVWRGLRWRLAPDEIYLWDCRTEPGHEGRGLYRAALWRAARDALTAGARAVWIESETANRASIRGIEAAGFAAAVPLAAWHALGVTFWRAGAGWPRPALAPVPLSAARAAPPPRG
jgi:hypothetical protein